MNNPNCDGGRDHSAGEVRVLPYGGDGNLILCRACFDHEIQYRRAENHRAGCGFDTPRWNSLKVYEVNA